MQQFSSLSGEETEKVWTKWTKLQKENDASRKESGTHVAHVSVGMIKKPKDKMRTKCEFLPILVLEVDLMGLGTSGSAEIKRHVESNEDEEDRDHNGSSSSSSSSSSGGGSSNGDDGGGGGGGGGGGRSPKKMLGEDEFSSLVENPFLSASLEGYTGGRRGRPIQSAKEAIAFIDRFRKDHLPHDCEVLWRVDLLGFDFHLRRLVEDLTEHKDAFVSNPLVQRFASSSSFSSSSSSSSSFS